MTCYSIDGIIPVVHPETYVHPAASLIGDVIVAAGCYIGPGASLRGDIGRIVIEEGSNIQDNCVLHCLPGAELLVRREGHIGHGAVLHGCRLEANVLVGINAIIMDEAVIGESSIIAAGAFIKSGFTCPPRSLVIGAPGRVVRELMADDLAWKKQATLEYQRLARRCLATLRETAPLKDPEPGRPRFSAQGKTNSSLVQ
jgi:phenylacetic acid degradation protein